MGKRSVSGHRLKVLRVISAAVFAVLMVSFFFFEPHPLFILSRAGYFQFLPSLIRGLVAVEFAAILVFAGVVTVTLLFGRFYCASVCPLGVFQDLLVLLSRRKKKGRLHFARERVWLRYGILAGVIIAGLSGIFTVVSVIDPYTVFARGLTLLAKPLFGSAANGVSTVLESAGYYLIPPVKISLLYGIVVISGSALFVLAGVLAVLRGRLYCNTICPVGTVLGFLSRVSFLRIRIDRKACTRCRICEKECRAGCIDIENQHVDHSRCVLCFDCAEVCPVSAVSFRALRGEVPSGPADPSRREFFSKTGMAAGAAGLLSVPLLVPGLRRFPEQRSVSEFSGEDTGRLLPASPPGSKSIDHLVRSCTACGLCVSACPTKVIRPALLDYGFSGLFLPVMDYSHGFCEYECNACSLVCPSGALLPLKSEDKKLTQIGEAHLMIEKCIVETKKQQCGACAEVCPTRAVFMVEREGLFYPETDTAYCIGCGSCHHACPAEPLAIVVRGSHLHGRAEPPVEREPVVIPAEEAEEEFPF